jgi:hypothetical protein
MISEPHPARAAPEIIVDPDGRSAAEQALDHGGPRAAVWVGEPTDAALEEFRAEIGRRR